MRARCVHSGVRPAYGDGTRVSVAASLRGGDTVSGVTHVLSLSQWYRFGTTEAFGPKDCRRQSAAER